MDHPRRSYLPQRRLDHHGRRVEGEGHPGSSETSRQEEGESHVMNGRDGCFLPSRIAHQRPVGLALLAFLFSGFGNLVPPRGRLSLWGQGEYHSQGSFSTYEV